MILEGEYKHIEGKADGNMEVTFQFPKRFQKKFSKEIKKDKLYRFEIEEIKDRRTLRQNRYMWALLKEIAQEINGDYNSEEIYCMAISIANIKSYEMKCVEEAESILRAKFRVVKPLERELINGVSYRNYRVYRGSSDMDTKEMGLLIDTILDLASKVGIDTGYWKGLLYEE